MIDLIGKMFDQMGGASPEAPRGPGLPDPSPSLADPYSDHATIIARVKKSIDNTDKLRWAFERLWFRSVLYYLGNQWLTWDARSRRWREKKLRKWVPRPVTNRFASTVDTIVSAIQSTRVMPSAWPSTEDIDDIAAANVADRLIPVINDEIDINRVRAAVARWMVINGDALVLPVYDKKDSSLGRTSIQSLRCDVCQAVGQPLEFESGTCPHCGQPSSTSPAFDEAGSPVNEQYAMGRMKVEVYSPMEVYLNLDLPHLEDHQTFTSFRAYSLETIKALWPENGAKVEADSTSATRVAKYFMEAISYSTEDSGYNLTGAASRDRATVYRHFEMPSQEYPEGLWVVMSSNEVLLEVGPSPYYDDRSGEKEFYWPLIKFPYSQVPGRLYAKTPAFDLLQKQDQLNRLESLIELATMRGTYGTWLIPTGSSISQTSGEPGLQVRYTPSGTGGAKPEIVTQNPIPASLFEWKQQIIADFEEIGGTFDALKGNVPRGVSAGYAIQLLTERSYGRFGSVFENWESGWVKLYEICLKLFRTYATEERIARIKGDAGKWEIQKFSNASLKGSVDLKVEGAASRPRSKLAEQALIETLTKIGVITPAADPEQRYRVAELFGMGHMLGALDDDKRAAAKEWEDFNSGTPPKVMLVVDNHMAHISDHRKRALGDEFAQMPDQQRLMWQQHIEDHMKALQILSGAQAPPAPSGKSAGGSVLSKASEQGDQTMNQLRSGGNSTLGAGGTD